MKNMRKKYTAWVAVFAVSLLLTAGKGPKLTMTEVAEGISVGFPKDWYPMGEDEIATKYPSSRNYLAMYTFLDRTADFGVSLSRSNFPGSDPKVLLNAYKSVIIESYDSLQWIQCDTAVINGRIYSVFEYTAKAGKTSSYNYLQSTVVRNHIIVFNFQAPSKDKAKWAPQANAIMHSIHIRPKQLVLPEVMVPEHKGMTPQGVLKDQKNRKNKK